MNTTRKNMLEIESAPHGELRFGISNLGVYLNRNEVQNVIGFLQSWLDTGTFFKAGAEKPVDISNWCNPEY